VDVDLLVLEGVFGESHARGVGAQVGEGGLRRLAHDLAQMAGEDQAAALAGHARRLDEQDVAAHRGPGEAGGDAGAVGALGGVGINLALRQSYISSQSATSAFWIFLAFYVLASVVTWVMYVRRPSSAPATSAEPVPNLAKA
jgi:nitrate/nitrite transporter NarK